MSNIVDKIFTYFKNRKAINSIKKIDKYLEFYGTRIHWMNKITVNIQSRRSIITDEEMQHQLMPYRDMKIYFIDDMVFNINNELRLYFESCKSSVFELEEYLAITKKFDVLKGKLLTELTQIENVRAENNRLVQEQATLVLEFLEDIKSFREHYFTHSQVQLLKNTFKLTYGFFQENVSDIKDEDILSFIDIYKRFDSYVVEWNTHYIKHEMLKHEKLFDNIDGKSLDEQQRIAVVTDEDSNLVLAGAGSGKTLTISGKVKYLVDMKGISPSDILLISFTRKSADEMTERISGKLGIEVVVKTFHKLGLEIIAKANRSKPDIFDELSTVLDEYFKEKIYESGWQIKNVIEFFGYYINIPKDYSDFQNLGEYHDYYKNLDFETLKGKVSKTEYVHENANRLSREMQTINGETVKSFEETLIANFLFLNGVNYSYEQPYKHNTSDEYHRQYKPDFYLPDYDLYIEHFGVDENDRTPWLSNIEQEKYLDGMVWKRKLHRDYNTKLIETFSHYNKNGVLLEKLQEKLLAHEVKFREADYGEIFTKIYDDQNKDKYFRELVKLIGSFISLFKSNGFKSDDLSQFIEENKTSTASSFTKMRTHLFMELVKPIYLHYQEELRRNDAVDFNDMINMATDFVAQNTIRFHYKYIMIDEYQDISKSRFKLISAIKDQTAAKVVCVGDDWQSIYRFAGSDIQLFTKFEDYFGFHALMKIENTYRNSQQLIDIAGQFVMQNQSQFRKNLVSSKSLEQPIRIMGYKKDIVSALKNSIEELVNQYGSSSEILLLGRNNFDIKILNDRDEFVLQHDQSQGITMIKYNKYSDLKMSFLTSHRSKGLEAENVIIINSKNSLVGFPNKIADDPILGWVLTEQDNYDFAEERRLFYVSLTRTQNTCIILAPESSMSVFAKELVENNKVAYSMVTNEDSLVNNPNCPRCITGFLTKRQGGQGESFLGCSNYPGCDFTLKYIQVLKDKKKCNVCGGFMILRSGRYGKFYGCTNYPRCRNTIKLA